MKISKLFTVSADNLVPTYAKPSADILLTLKFAILYSVFLANNDL